MLLVAFLRLVVAVLDVGCGSVLGREKSHKPHFDGHTN
jgi:hypothetical protein